MEELLEHRENPIRFTFFSEESHPCLFVPSIFDLDNYKSIIPCGWLKKSWKNTKSFVKKHKKAIIIGAIIVVTVSAVTIAVIASSSGAASAFAGSAAAMAASNSSDYDCEEDPSPSSFESTIKEGIEFFKENIVKDNLLNSSDDPDPSLEAIGKTIGNIWAHQTFEELYNHSPSLAKELQSHIHVPISWNDGEDLAEVGSRIIDQKFSIDYDYPYSYITTNCNNKILPYQIKAKKAFDLGYYPEAIRNLDQAISIDSNDSTLYLERAVSHFHVGDYDQSIQDFATFKNFKISNENPFIISAFSVGFAKGLPLGVYKSGKGIMVFLSDFLTHPIYTSTQVIESFSRLAQMVKKDEWDIIGKSIAPEIYELVKDWETLPSDKKGELAGYALGKYGTDIIAPGALAKVASKSLKSAKELATVCRNIKVANKTLLLEAAAGINETTKIAEVVTSAETNLFLGEELGFTTREIGSLKESAQLESTIKSVVNQLSPSLQESLKKYNQAQKNLSVYIKQPLPENIIKKYICDAGIPTFPRPQGIPSNYITRITEKGAGIEYVHPNNPHISIRVMPGKPHSPNSYQQNPYVIQMKNGKAIDKCGNQVNKKLPEAHIPLEEFNYIP